MSLATKSPDCASGACLVENLAPRFDAPQSPVGQPAIDSYCSCRCDGPAGAGPFCACPDGFSCTPLVHDIGLESSADVAGSYCVKNAAPAH